MIDIFISYQREDRPIAQNIAELFEKEGFSVWWDRIIPAGSTWEDVIEQAIESAKCVVVLWSNNSVKSKWVKAEAAEGEARGVLVPVKIDDVTLPLKYRHVQTVNLINWKGSSRYSEFRKLVNDIRTIIDNVDSRDSEFKDSDDEDTVQRDTEQVEDDFKKAEFYYDRGMECENDGDYEKAAEFFTKAIERDSQNADYYYKRGLSYSTIDDLEKAIEDLSKVIELNPYHANAYFERGLCYEALDKLKKAIRDYTKSIDYNFEYPIVYWKRGIVNRALGQYDEAVSDLNEYLNIGDDEEIKASAREIIKELGGSPKY